MVASALFDLANMAGMMQDDDGDGEDEDEDEEEGLPPRYRQQRRSAPAGRGGRGKGGKASQAGGNGQRKRGRPRRSEVERGDSDPEYFEEAAAAYDSGMVDEEVFGGAPRSRTGGVGSRVGKGSGANNRWPLHTLPGARGVGAGFRQQRVGGGGGKGSRVVDDDAASGLSPGDVGSGREMSPFPPLGGPIFGGGLAGIPPGWRGGWGAMGGPPPPHMLPPWMMGAGGGPPPGGMMPSPQMLSPALLSRLFAAQQQQHFAAAAAAGDPAAAAMIMHSLAAAARNNAATAASGGGAASSGAVAAVATGAASSAGNRHGASGRRCAIHVSIARFIMEQRRAEAVAAAASVGKAMGTVGGGSGGRCSAEGPTSDEKPRGGLDASDINHQANSSPSDGCPPIQRSSSGVGASSAAVKASSAGQLAAPGKSDADLEPPIGASAGPPPPEATPSTCKGTSAPAATVGEAGEVTGDGLPENSPEAAIDGDAGEGRGTVAGTPALVPNKDRSELQNPPSAAVTGGRSGETGVTQPPPSSSKVRERPTPPPPMFPFGPLAPSVGGAPFSTLLRPPLPFGLPPPPGAAFPPFPPFGSPPGGVPYHPALAAALAVAAAASGGGSGGPPVAGGAPPFVPPFPFPGISPHPEAELSRIQGV